MFCVGICGICGISLGFSGQLPCWGSCCCFRSCSLHASSTENTAPSRARGAAVAGAFSKTCKTLRCIERLRFSLYGLALLLISILILVNC